ncbi:MAG: hypothetical protein JXQ96_08895 [Cyclobacteriaceae bacterium]
MSITFLLSMLLFVSCGSEDNPIPDESSDVSDYIGSGSITQGLGNTTIANLFAEGQRVAPLGTITSKDNNTWTVPADVNYTETSFPFASELYNPFGSKFTSATEALAALDGNDIIEIDANGEVITGYIFADNYFELYVNGVAVGKDAIPFTEFNSHILRFKVSKPYTLAFKLVDWEEDLGLGLEARGGLDHPGDGGLVAVFKDATNSTVAITDGSWKAQTYYTAPVQNLGCLSEDGSKRLSTNCSTVDASDGSSFYGVHWALPSDWMNESYDDNDWPDATTYTNSTIGVDNKPSYTNFVDVFDDNSNDAQFIWSTNVILDNLVLARYTVE